jgi:fibronectin type 3 domain-containing protein
MPLPTPNAIRVTSGKIRHVPLSWDRYGYKEADGYKIFRSDSKDGHYSEIAKLDGAESTSYDDRGRTDNATYWYRVSVFKKTGVETDMSEPVSAVVREIPPAPLEVTAAGGMPRMVTLRWNVAGTAADEIKSVIIYRMLEEKDVNLEKISEVPAGQTVYNDDKQPLKDNTAYYYRLCARNSGGAVSMQTVTVSALTKAPPKVPGNVSATSGEVKRTVLAWDRNRETDIEEYQVFVKLPGETDFKQLRKLTGNSSIESDLKDGTGYSYKIRAW